MDKIKHPKRYKAYLKGYENGSIQSSSNKFGEGLFIGIMLAGLFWGIMALIWGHVQ
jgi:hypothetical protein